MASGLPVFYMLVSIVTIVARIDPRRLMLAVMRHAAPAGDAIDRAGVNALARAGRVWGLEFQNPSK
jgi:hypothetical protein